MRLIDADAFKEFIEKVYRPLCDDYHMKSYVLNQLLHDIENEPTVDAVPISFIINHLNQGKEDKISSCLKEWEDADS